MIVMKFGGTSVQDLPALQRAADIVAARGGEGPVVVVSALAGVTRGLLEMGSMAAGGRVDDAVAALGELMGRHLDLLAAMPANGARDHAHHTVQDLGGELEPLLRGIGLLREFDAPMRDAVAGFGERLSSPVFRCVLTGRGVDCTEFDVCRVMITDDRFGNARPLADAFREAVDRELVPARDGGRAVVTQGYVGRTATGRPTTMGFEASDYTATLLGAALGAREVQIWTDVSGMLTADPRLVPQARPIAALRFADAAELALLGAKVLHPRSTAPVERAGIPVRVLNAGNPDVPGTRIDHDGNAADVSGVTSVALLTEVTALRLSPFTWDDQLLHRVTAAAERSGATIRLVTASPLGVTLVVDSRTLSAGLREELRRMGAVGMDGEVAAVSVVGPGVERAEILTGALGALEGLPIRAVIQGASPHSISFVVPAEAGKTAVQRLHRHFFEKAGAGGEP